MAVKSRNMNDMMRMRRHEMAAASRGEDMPMMEIEIEEEESPKNEQKSEKQFKVAAPGEPSTGENFEYEPFIDIPGAWVVYPPGVPCDDNEYRVVMDEPAKAADFDKMQMALDNRESSSPRPPATEKKVEPGNDYQIAP